MKTYPDWVLRAQVQAYLHKRTGTLVTTWRITHWITAGELRTVKVPTCGGYKHYVTKESLEKLIAHYSA